MHVRKILPIGLLAASLAVSDCNCQDDLASTTGELHLELCDRGAACGCEIIGGDDGVIDFGSPGAGGSNQRVLLIKNDNQPRKLIIDRLTIDGPAGVFSVASVRRRSSDASD